MSQSPPLEATGEHRAMGATAPGQGIKGDMAKDADQRKQYFGGDASNDKQQASAGSEIEKASSAADDSAGRAADRYKADKEERF